MATLVRAKHIAECLAREPVRVGVSALPRPKNTTRSMRAEEELTMLLDSCAPSSDNLHWQQSASAVSASKPGV